MISVADTPRFKYTGAEGHTYQRCILLVGNRLSRTIQGQNTYLWT